MDAIASKLNSIHLIKCNNNLNLMIVDLSVNRLLNNKSSLNVFYIVFHSCLLLDLHNNQGFRVNKFSRLLENNHSSSET